MPIRSAPGNRTRLAEADLAGLDGISPLGRGARSRRWARAGLALGLALACGAASLLLYDSAGSRQPVLAVARALPEGAVITSSDLRTARLPTDPAISPVPAGALGTVVGRRVGVPLEPGSLLTPADLATGPL